MKNERLSNFQLIPYKIRLTTPLRTAKGRLDYRQGILLKLQTDRLREGIGECAPLPCMGTETLQAANMHLNKLLPGLLGSTIQQLYNKQNPDFPAVNFALETALLDLLSKQQNNSIAKCINKNAANCIRVNAMLGCLDNQIEQKARQAEIQGFKVLKIKIGIKPFEEELSLLQRLIEHLLPQTLLRLDANQAWDIGQSKAILVSLEKYAFRIDSLEEPLKQFKPQQYRELQKMTSIPLALDESFSSQAIPLLQAGELPVQRIIIKPLLIGSLQESYRLAKTAEQQHLQAIISSSIETGYGLWANTHLAAAVNNKQTHGLATGHWLKETLIPAPTINNAKINLDL